MAADPDDQPPIRRGRGLRLSTARADVSEADTQRLPAAPPEQTPAQAPAPAARRRGLRLSTPPPSDAATPAEAKGQPADEVPIAGAAPAAPEPGPGAARWRIATATGPTSYLRTGEGPPLLLLHGFGASARFWSVTARALGDMRACYALDLPGCGASPPRPAAPTLGALADEVLACAEALGLARFDLIGHSLGAAVAAVLAGRHPARVGRLVAVSLGARPFAPELAALSLGRGPLDLTLGLARPLLDLWRPVGRAVMQSPPLAAGLGALMLQRPPASPELWRDFLADHAASDPRAYLTSLAAPGDPALHAALRAITAPTLCVAGRDDRVARLPETTRAHELVPGSSMLVLDGCGHMPMLERPEEFHLALRRFLTP